MNVYVVFADVEPREFSVNVTGTLVDKVSAPLTHTEMALLTTLAKNSGRAVSKERLISDAWNCQLYVTDDALKERIRSLRNKIGKDKILTIRGYGYMMAQSGVISG